MNAITPAGGMGTPLPVPTAAQPPVGNRGLFFIAVFALVKGVFFAIAAAGIFHLVNRDVQDEIRKLLHAIRLSGDSTFIKALLLKAKLITDPGKRILSGVLLLYAVMYAIEGTGLLLRKRWAEYFTAGMTAIPLPFEIYVLIHHGAHPEFTHVASDAPQLPGIFSSHVFVLKLAALFINAGILWYLIYHLRRETRHDAVEEAGPEIDQGAS